VGDTEALFHELNDDINAFDEWKKTVKTDHPVTGRNNRVTARLVRGEVGKAANCLRDDASVLDPDLANIAEALQKLFRKERLEEWPVQQATNASAAGTVAVATGMITVSNSDLPMNAIDIGTGAQATNNSTTTTAASTTEAEGPLELKEICTALRSMGLQSGQGRSGWRISYLNCIASTDHGQFEIHKLVNYLWECKAPDVIRKLMNDGLGTLLSKDNKMAQSEIGESKIRPIVVQEPIMRLLEKTLCNRTQSQMARLLDHQFAIGVKGGAEVLIHLTRMLRESRPELAFIALDISSAYHNITVASILSELDRMRVQQPTESKILRSFICKFLENPSDLFTRGKAKAVVADGLTQGRPLSPLLFAIGMNAVLRDVVAELSVEQRKSNVHNFFLDDGLIGAKPEHIVALYKLVAAKLVARGMKLNNSKAQVLYPVSMSSNAERNKFKEMIVHELQVSAPADAIKFLGAFVGNVDAEQRMASDLIDFTVFDRLIEYTNVQGRFQLLQRSISLLANFVSRTMRPETVISLLRQFDEKVMLIVAGVLGRRSMEQFDANTRADVHKLTRMETEHGGLGLGSQFENAHNNYFASVAAFVRIIQSKAPQFNDDVKRYLTDESQWSVSKALRAAMKESIPLMESEHFRKASMVNTQRPPTPRKPMELIEFLETDKLQRSLSHVRSKLLEESFVKTLRDRISAAQVQHSGEGESLAVAYHQRVLADYRAKTGRAAGAWLFAPMSGPNRFNDNEFTIALCQRVGCPALPLFGINVDPGSKVKCPCSEGSGQEVLTEHHLLHCKFRGHSTIRHNNCVMTLAQCARSVGYDVVVEPNIEGSQKRGDLKMSHALEAGQFVVYDFSCVNPASKTSVNKNKNSTDSLAAAKHAYEEKEKMYKHLIEKPDSPKITFKPLIAQAQGSVLPDGVPDFIRQMAYHASIRRPAECTPLDADFTSHWFKRFSVALIRSNAATVLDVVRAVRKRNIIDPSQRTVEEDFDVADPLPLW